MRSPCLWKLTPHTSQTRRGCFKLISAWLPLIQNSGCRRSISYCSLLSSVVPSCTSALFYNDKEDTHLKCNFRFLNDIIKPSVEYISSDSLLVYQTKTLAFDCPTGQQIQKGCSFCLIQIPCLCSIKTDSLFIPAKVGNCNNNTDIITIQHPVNLALIQHFFSADTYNSIMGDTKFTKPIDMTLPRIQMFNHSFTNLIAQDQKLHLSLKRIAKAAKEDKKIFTTLSEPLLDGEIEIDNSWPDTNGIISVISLSLSILLTIACVTLFNKVRALTTALILLQKSPPTYSFVTPQTPPTFHYIQSQETTTRQHFNFILSAQLSQWPSVVLAALTVLSFVAAIHYIYQLVTSNHHTKVLLEISNGIRCITIPIVHLPLCPSDWDISSPQNISNLRITGTFFTTFHAEWTAFSIVNTHTKQIIEIPLAVKVNPVKARLLRNMFKSPFTSYILVAHHRYFKIIQ